MNGVLCNEFVWWTLPTRSRSAPLSGDALLLVVEEHAAVAKLLGHCYALDDVAIARSDAGALERQPHRAPSDTPIVVLRPLPRGPAVHGCVLHGEGEELLLLISNRPTYF